MSKRKMETLARPDLGKHIAFTSTNGRAVRGVLRSFSHGIYSDQSKGEIDVHLVAVTLYTYRSHEGHWAELDTLAELTNVVPESDVSELLHTMDDHCPRCFGVCGSNTERDDWEDEADR